MTDFDDMPPDPFPETREEIPREIGEARREVFRTFSKFVDAVEHCSKVDGAGCMHDGHWGWVDARLGTSIEVDVHLGINTVRVFAQTAIDNILNRLEEQ